MFGGLYSYEWLAWTSRSQEAALKRQFVKHMKEKVQLQVKAVNNNCVYQMQGMSFYSTTSHHLSPSPSPSPSPSLPLPVNLQSLRGRLLHRLEICKKEAKGRAQQLAREKDTLSVLSSRLKALR